MNKNLKKAIQYFSFLKEIPFFKNEYLNDLKNLKVNIGQIQSELNSAKKNIDSIQDVEFKIFSQWGDDGIIQYLIRTLDIPYKTFIEFGVEDYRESNTRFLLINNKWHGMIIDGSKKNTDYIKGDKIHWAYHLYVVNTFITKSNINKLLSDFLEKGYNGEVGLLSVDIDGNDYWIWDEINVINPVIVIVEYNAVFGKERAITIPYKDDFNRFLLGKKGYLYYGASVEAFKQLGNKKGYTFIGTNSNGNNAYFVRNDKCGPLQNIIAKASYTDSSFREASDVDGDRLYGQSRLKLIEGMPVIDVISGTNTEI